jgi:hypothetical protein
MHPLLRYTLDLFDPLPSPVAVQAKKPVVRRRKPFHSSGSKAFESFALVDTAQPAIENIAPANFAHPQATREVRLGDAVVAYAFTRAKRRTIGFVVGPDGLVVRAPRWTPLYEVDSALQEKAQWILRKLHEHRERHTRQEEARIQWADGVVVPYMGGNITVLLDPGHSFAQRGAQLDEAPSADAASPHPLLRVALPKAAAPEQIRDAVQAWLMRQATSYFTQRLDHFAPLLKVKWHRMRLSSAGTRWGSASADGAIALNWRLIHMSPPVIDYVVAHELSHLRVMDHSPRFWDTVATVVPDYATLRSALKDDAVPKW